ADTRHQLRRTIYSAGIPAAVRSSAWLALSGAAPHLFETLYSQLICEPHTPAESEIQRDIARTFPGSPAFRDAHGDGQRKLYCLLKAYSLYDAEVGYCQGLGFVLGVLIMFLSEHEAFAAAARLMDHYDMRELYVHDMRGLHLRLWQLTRTVERELPRLARHLSAHGISAALYASSWFVSLFAYSYPLPLVFRIVDVALLDG
ncbi:RabGAP/TBC, partial [Ramicandelaber brevisporus]